MWVCIVLLISLILHPASTKCPQTKNPANAGLLNKKIICF